MKLKYQDDALCGKYDERNLTISKSGKYKYPSKKMFVEFLKLYKDVDGVADIWSEQNIFKGEVVINVKVKYKVKDYKLRDDAVHAEIEHPKNCKGCPDCPGKYVCKCGKEFDELNTEHECVFHAVDDGGKA